MNRRPRRACTWLVAWLAACTSPNPYFTGESDDATVLTDGSGGSSEGGQPAGDGQVGTGDLTATDHSGPPDQQQPPDGPPPACNGNLDCADNLLCTQDRCVDGFCKHPLEPGFCLIDGVCYLDDQLHPTESCQRCAAQQDPHGWVAAQEGSPCEQDAHSCTTDACKQGACTHDLAPGWCLIGGSCTPAGESHGDGCELCDPGKATDGWSPAADGTACALDGKACTDDICKAGVCTHPVTDGCLISGVCVGEGQVGGVCLECVPEQSVSSFTFVDGKPCLGSSSGLSTGAFCVAQACRSFTESSYEPPLAIPDLQLTGTSLRAVAVVPTAAGGQVWAAGGYAFDGSGGDILPGGVLVRLDQPDTFLASKPLTAVHRALAIGSGQAYLHDGSGWSPAPQLHGQLSGGRLAVWGAEVSGQSVYYLSGVAAPPASLGMYRCSVLFSSVTCASNFSGFTQGAELGGVFASIDASGGQGPVWAITRVGAEDIYANDGSSTVWSQGIAGGCQDLGAGGSTPCSRTDGDFRDIHGSASDDVWVVGDHDIVLSYDGSSWTRHGGINQLDNHEMDAVYSHPGDNLVSVVGYRDTNQGRLVALFNYNRKLERWFGPVPVKYFFGNKSDARVFDIAGTSYTDLWMVGQARDAFAGDKVLKGWVLHLQ